MLGIITIIGSIIAIILTITYKPTVEVNSWGNPDEGEACGWFLFICVSLILEIGLAIGGLMLIARGY